MGAILSQVAMCYYIHPFIWKKMFITAPNIYKHLFDSGSFFIIRKTPSIHDGEALQLLWFDQYFFA